ncbi:MAG: hypothetical protein WCG45_05225 [bacterium]
MKKVPNWIFSLKKQILKSWEHHSLCESVNFVTNWDKRHSCWSIEAEPVMQEIIGGKEDGEKVWSGFVFDFLKFSSSDEIYINKCFVKSAITSFQDDLCTEPEEFSPCFMIKGKFKENKFLLSILLEPSENSEIKESINYENEVVKRRD